MLSGQLKPVIHVRCSLHIPGLRKKKDSCDERTLHVSNLKEMFKSVGTHTDHVCYLKHHLQMQDL